MGYKQQSPIVIKEGGTNATSMTTTDGVVYFDGTSLVTTAVGTATHVLTSNGSGIAPTFQPAGGGGGGITTINGDQATFVTGSTVTLSGFLPGGIGQSTQFIGDDSTTMNLSLTDSSGNFYGGSVGVGFYLASSFSEKNFLFGVESGQFLGFTGSPCNNNIAIGYQSLNQATYAFNCVAIGRLAGTNYAVGEHDNILLSNTGVTGETGAIHIGDFNHSSCFIAGISGVTVANTAAVLIDTTTGQLGTVISSRRFKKDIVDMEDTSRLLSLRPVNFVYKESKVTEKQYGLIAEEVESVLPELVIYDKEGLPSSVKYHELPILLLNEMKRLSQEVADLKRQLNK